MAHSDGVSRRHLAAAARQWSASASARSPRFARLMVAIVGLASWQVQAGELEEAFNVAKAFVAPLGWSARLEIVNDPGTTIALAASYQRGECRVVALKDSAYLVVTLNALPLATRRPYLEALFAHELGHCEEQYTAQSGSRPIENVNAALISATAHVEKDGTIRLRSFRGDVLWSEVLADAYTGLFLRERYPGLAKPLMDWHLRKRMSADAVDPEHNTGPYLAGAEFSREPRESLIAAAIRLRTAGTTPFLTWAGGRTPN